MKSYLVAPTEQDGRANLGREIMASSDTEAVSKYLALGGHCSGLVYTAVWVAPHGEPGREFHTAETNWARYGRV